MLRFVLLIIVGLSATAVQAQDARIDSMQSAFSDWTSRHSVRNAGLATVIGGELVASESYGHYNAESLVPVASESKAITGICISKMVESGAIEFDDPLGTLLPDFANSHEIADSRATGITVAQLLTHTSGIGYDPTQGRPLLQFRPFSEGSAEVLLAAALADSLASQPDTAFSITTSTTPHLN